MRNDEETWESLQLASNVYNVGDDYPQENFDFYIDGVSDKNLYCSNQGIKIQIQESLKLNPNRQKLVYFFYKKMKIK